jgi:hypothetical protein
MPVGTIVPIATVLHSTLTQSRKKLVLASVKSNALMAWVFSTERIEMEDGGYNITNPITLGRNPNVTSYNYYNQLPVAQTNEFDTVEYGWSRVAGTVIISDQEQDENRSDVAIFKLVTAKMNVLEESVKEKFSQYLYAAGGGADPLGLPSLVPNNPTTGTLGGINRATETQWRTSAYNYAGALDSTNIEEAFDDVLMDLTLKGDKPDVIIAGRNVIRTYRQAVRDKVVLNLADSSKGRSMFDLGFDGIMHNRTPIIYDEDCPITQAYFLNSKYLRLHILRHVNMKVKELTSPWTMDASGQRVVWQGQWCLWRAFRTHATLLM